MTNGVSSTIGGRSRRPNRGYPNANMAINTEKFRIEKCGMRKREMWIAEGEVRDDHEFLDLQFWRFANPIQQFRISQSAIY
jgi:hypothetical protein